MILMKKQTKIVLDLPGQAICQEIALTTSSKNCLKSQLPVDKPEDPENVYCSITSNVGSCI